MRGLADRGGERVDHLLVVTEDLHLMLGEEVVLERDVLGRGVDPVHDVGLEGERRQVPHAHRVEQVVGHRLGGGHRRPGGTCLNAAMASATA